MESAISFVRTEAAYASLEDLHSHCAEFIKLLREEIDLRNSLETKPSKDGENGDGQGHSDTAEKRVAQSGPERPPDPATMVSVAHQLNVQIVLECLLCWVVYPYLALGSGQEIFGAKPKCRDWSMARDSAKSLRLEDSIKNQGFQVKLCDESLARGAHAVLEGLCTCRAFAHFLQDRYLGDRCLISEALNETILPDMKSTRDHVSGMLRALQLQARYAQALKTHGVTTVRQREVRSKLGRRLSELVTRRGGVLAVMTTMLTNVPHGNIQAFQQVSKLLIQKPEGRKAIADQLVDLIRESLRDADTQRGALVRRSAVMTVNSLVVEDENIVREHVLQPFVKTLSEPANETAILQAVEFVRILLAAAPPDPKLVQIIADVIPLILELWWFTSMKSCRGEGETQALVRLWLDHTDPDVGVKLLRKFASFTGPPGWTARPNGIRLKLRKSEDGGPSLLESLGEPSAQSESRDPMLNLDKDAESAYLDLNPEDRSSYVIKLVRNHQNSRLLQNHLFAQALRGVAHILERESSQLDPQVAADVVLIQGLLENQANFALSKQYIDVEAVVNGISELLSGCAQALGLWRHEAEQPVTGKASARGAFALDLAPVALAMAASLASSEANADLWSAKDGPSRYKVLERLLTPLSALSRMDDETVIAQIIDSQALAANEATEVYLNKAKGAIQGMASEIAELASAVRVAILTNPEQQNQSNDASRWSLLHAREERRQQLAEGNKDIDIFDPLGDKISDAEQDLRSKDPPIRAMGLDKLRGVLSGILQPTDAHFIEIVDILVSTLQDEDSYVYLICVKALSFACERFPQQMFPRLINLFLDESVPINVRIRIGEALASSARRAGQLLPVFAPQLILAFCNGASGRSDNIANVKVDEQGRYRTPAQRKAIAKIKPPEELLTMFRTSCLSNLADVSAQAPWAAFKYASSVVALAKGTLTFDKQVSARRAAAYVLLKMIEGAASMEDARGLHEIPHELREAMHIINDIGDQDTDKVVRFHCDRARGVLDSLIRKFAFPDPQREKVLHVGLGLDRL